MAAKEVNELNEVEEVKEGGARMGPATKYNDLLVYKQTYRLAVEVVPRLTKLFRAKNSSSLAVNCGAAQRPYLQIQLRAGRSGIQQPSLSGI